VGEERLLALAGSTIAGYKEIFSQLTNVDMKFGTLTTNHGEKIVLTEFWLNQTSDPRIRAFLIDRSLERMRSALVRQTMFAEFEKIIHETEEAGDGLTLEFFRETYGSLLKDYLGPDITIDPELELECLRVPHFYSAFYVYRYAIGISAAMMLATEIKTGDEEVKSRYLDVLRSGRTKFPIDALLESGIDLRSSEPILNAMKVFADRLARLREILREQRLIDPDYSETVCFACRQPNRIT
jgi:oligoendopeptidase F